MPDFIVLAHRSSNACTRPLMLHRSYLLYYALDVSRCSNNRAVVFIYSIFINEWTFVLVESDFETIVLFECPIVLLFFVRTPFIVCILIYKNHLVLLLDDLVSPLEKTPKLRFWSLRALEIHLPKRELNLPVFFCN